MFIVGKIVYKYMIILYVLDKKNLNEEILDKLICICLIELYSFIKKKLLLSCRNDNFIGIIC